MAAAVVLVSGLTTAATTVPEGPSNRAAGVRVALDHAGVQGPVVTVPAGETVAATVSCPAGREPSGGGGGSDGRGIFIASSAAHGNDWAVELSNESGGPLRGAAFVVCTQGAHFRHVGTSVTVPGGGSGTATATAYCPAGQLPTGGGFLADGTNVFASSMYSDQSNRWFVRVGNDTSFDTSVSAFVLCSPNTQSRRETSVVLPPGAEETQSVSCPPGEVAAGGGGRSDALGNPGVVISTSRALPDGHGWSVRATNRSNTAHTLTAQAICTAF